MLKKYNFYSKFNVLNLSASSRAFVTKVFKALLNATIFYFVSFAGSTLAMNDQIYFDDQEKTAHIEKIDKLQNQFKLSEVGKEIFSRKFDKEVFFIALSDDARFACIINIDFIAEIVNIETGKTVKTFTDLYSNHPYYYDRTTFFSLNNKFIILKNSCGEVELINLEKDEVIKTYTEIESISFSFDKRFMLLLKDNKEVEIVDFYLECGKTIKTYGKEFKVSFSKNGNYIIAEVKKWNKEEERKIELLSLKKFNFIASYSNFKNYFISPNCKFIFLQLYNNVGQLIHIETGKILYTCKDFSGNNFCFSPNSRFMFIGDNKELINLETDKVITKYFNNFVEDVSFSKDDKYIFISKYKEQSELINLEADKVIGCYGIGEKAWFSENSKYMILNNSVINLETKKIIVNESVNHGPEFNQNYKLLSFSRLIKNAHDNYYTSKRIIVNLETGEKIVNHDPFEEDVSKNKRFMISKKNTLLELEPEKILIKNLSKLSFCKDVLVFEKDNKNFIFYKLFDKSTRLFRENLKNKCFKNGNNGKYSLADAKIKTKN